MNLNKIVSLNDLIQEYFKLELLLEFLLSEISFGLAKHVYTT